jgi:hypothetical protein
MGRQDEVGRRMAAARLRSAADLLEMDHVGDALQELDDARDILMGSS